MPCLRHNGVLIRPLGLHDVIDLNHSVNNVQSRVFKKFINAILLGIGTCLRLCEHLGPALIIGDEHPVIGLDLLRRRLSFLYEPAKILVLHRDPQHLDVGVSALVSAAVQLRELPLGLKPHIGHQCALIPRLHALACESVGDAGVASVQLGRNAVDFCDCHHVCGR